MKLTPSTITPFDSFPYEDLKRPTVPVELLRIEKAVRKYLYQTLQPEAQSPFHDKPTLVASLQKESPKKIRLNDLMPELKDKFTDISLQTRIGRIMDIVGTGLTLTFKGEGDPLTKLRETERSIPDGTLCLEIFEHPECLEPEFLKKMRVTRNLFHRFFGNDGLIMQPFHPLESKTKIEGIPPLISVRRMHPGDRIFMATPDEMAVYEAFFGPATLN